MDGEQVNSPNGAVRLPDYVLREVVILRRPASEKLQVASLDRNTASSKARSMRTAIPASVLDRGTCTRLGLPFSRVDEMLRWLSRMERKHQQRRQEHRAHRALAPASASGQQVLASNELDRI
jgi:hypothetical protein